MLPLKPGEAAFDAAICQMALFDIAASNLLALRYLLKPGAPLPSIMHPRFNSAPRNASGERRPRR